MKSHYSRLPRKGTKARQAMLLMLRKQGATSEELMQLYGHRGAFFSMLEHIRNDKGWDIRSFTSGEREGPGRKMQTHRIVGKFKWDGSYRSFIDRALDRGPLRRAS